MEVNNTLEKLSQGKDNNLNLVRLVAAFMVMYMHSLALCQANLEADIMYTLTFHKALSGQVGVDIFFVISGFLIYRTWLGYFMGCARGLLFLSQKREERSGSPPQERDRSLLLN